MKRIHVYAATLVLALFGLVSCGEDRTYEFREKTQEAQWIYNQMNQWYLWYDELPPMDDYTAFFSDPESFFKKILSKNDKYSYIEMDESRTRSIDQHSSYGFDFALYVNPVTQSSSAPERYARVLYVLPHSPASEAGLKRGDWIAAMNGEQITEKNYPQLLNGPGGTLLLQQLDFDEQSQEIWWDESSATTLTLPASRRVEDNPFYVDTVYHIANHRIAYLFYNRFSTGRDDTGNEKEYGNQMREIFKRFKAAEPTDFILDLRYNPGGYLSCAQELGSLLAPQSAMGKVFYSLEFNDKMTDHNQKQLFEEKITGGANLNLNRIYIIVSSYTASASESIINGLIPYMGADNVILVGTTTEGKNVASLTFNSNFGFSIHPIVATVYNGMGESDYASGFAPTHELDELTYVNPFAPLGSRDEIMLSSTLDIIFQDSAADIPTRSTGLRLTPQFTTIRPAKAELPVNE